MRPGPRFASRTSRVFGDIEAFATTFNVVAPRLSFVVKTSSAVWVMVPETPPSNVSDAVAPVQVRVWTRDKAASNR